MIQFLLAGLSALAVQAETPDPLHEAAICATLSEVARNAIVAAEGTPGAPPNSAQVVARLDLIVRDALLDVQRLMAERGMEPDFAALFVEIEPRHMEIAADEALVAQTLRRCAAAYPAG